MVKIAMSVPLDDILAALVRRRPVFHSEADLQHAFAWEAHRLDPTLQVRLETHPEPNVRLDLLLSRSDLDRHTAVELKYLTAAWSGEHAGETFALKNHGAQDVRAYDAVKDIGRLERFVHQRANWNGVFIAITNDPMYWRPPTHGRATNADAFRIYEGSTLAGNRAWGPNTGAGTMKNRMEPIELAGAYALSWRDYSRISGARGQFRALVVEVD
ncbi:hypothetical protein [Kribbella karoonensis]|uniref:Restriction endonuclease n=1 Tax=Kribbella karoonensis TaxID=324851 RepID=A0ABP4PLW2_9ACTN